MTARLSETHQLRQDPTSLVPSALSRTLDAILASTPKRPATTRDTTPLRQSQTRAAPKCDTISPHRKVNAKKFKTLDGRECQPYEILAPPAVPAFSLPGIPQPSKVLSPHPAPSTHMMELRSPRRASTPLPSAQKSPSSPSTARARVTKMLSSLSRGAEAIQEKERYRNVRRGGSEEGVSREQRARGKENARPPSVGLRDSIWAW
jgi:hypothetical protein